MSDKEKKETKNNTLTITEKARRFVNRILADYKEEGYSNIQGAVFIGEENGVYNEDFLEIGDLITPLVEATAELKTLQNKGKNITDKVLVRISDWTANDNDEDEVGNEKQLETRQFYPTEWDNFATHRVILI